MNIMSNKTSGLLPFILFCLASLVCVAFFTCAMIQEAWGQHWPIPTGDTRFNYESCTFGELHGGLRFHGAIDIRVVA